MQIGSYDTLDLFSDTAGVPGGLQLLVSGKGWTKAADIEIDMHMVLSNGMTARVVDVTRGTAKKMYSLVVKDGRFLPFPEGGKVPLFNSALVRGSVVMPWQIYWFTIEELVTFLQKAKDKMVYRLPPVFSSKSDVLSSKIVLPDKAYKVGCQIGKAKDDPAFEMPLEYEYLNRMRKRALINGILDQFTRVYNGDNNYCTITVASKQFAYGLQALFWSYGSWCTIREVVVLDAETASPICKYRVTFMTNAITKLVSAKVKEYIYQFQYGGNHGIALQFASGPADREMTTVWITLEENAYKIAKRLPFCIAEKYLPVYTEKKIRFGKIYGLQSYRPRVSFDMPQELLRPPVAI